MAATMCIIKPALDRTAGMLFFTRTWLIRLCLFFSFYSVTALAHDPGLSLVDMQLSDNKLLVHITYAKADIEQFVALDQDQFPGVSDHEFNQARVELEQFIAQSIQFKNGNERVQAELTDIELDSSDAVHFKLQLMPLSGSELTLHTQISQFALGHRQFVKVLSADGLVSSAILSARNQLFNVSLPASDWWSVFNNFLQEGVWHIWIGYDHILFVITLLLPAVLVYRQQHWYPEKQFKRVFGHTVKVISAFTLAHSLTLALTVFNVIALPGTAVESVIAASVIVAAGNNLFHWINGRLWILAWVFGLIHGMGFAAVLNDLGMQSDTQALALIAFNLGVELGQLAIILVVLPALFFLRTTRYYKPLFMQSGSFAIALIATLWLFERLGEVSLFQYFI